MRKIDDRTAEEMFTSVKEDAEIVGKRYKESYEEMKSYYQSSNEDSSKESVDDMRPPHERLADRAARILITSATYQNDFEEIQANEGAHRWEVRFVLDGVGTEVLLNAVLLREKTDWYFKNSKPFYAPNIDECRPHIRELLSSECPAEVTDRVDNVLQLIWTQRNNHTHLGYHQEIMGPHLYVTYEVLEFLFAHFFDADREVVMILRERHTEANYYSDIDATVFPEIDFEPYK